MMITVPVMWITAALLLLYVIHSQLPHEFGTWMALFFPYVIDFTFFVLFSLMIFVLFDARMFFAVPFNIDYFGIMKREETRYSLAMEPTIQDPLLLPPSK